MSKTYISFYKANKLESLISEADSVIKKTV